MSPISDTIASLIADDVFPRFPNIRVATIENGAEWVAPLFAELKKSFKMRGRMAGGSARDVPPSRLGVTVLRGRPRALAELIGVDHILFGSDWPHAEGLADPLSYVEDLDEAGFSPGATSTASCTPTPHRTGATARLSVVSIRDRPVGAPTATGSTSSGWESTRGAADADVGVATARPSRPGRRRRPTTSTMRKPKAHGQDRGEHRADDRGEAVDRPAPGHVLAPWSVSAGDRAEAERHEHARGRCRAGRAPRR